MIKVNTYLGWTLVVLNTITLISYCALFTFIGKYVYLILPIVSTILFFFLVTGYSATRDRTLHPKFLNTVIWFGRFLLLFISTIAIIAGNEFIYVSLIAAILITTSYIFKNSKEVQVMIVNSCGLVLCGFISFGGLIGLLDSI